MPAMNFGTFKKKNTEYEFLIWVQFPFHFSRERMELTNTTKKFLLEKKIGSSEFTFFFFFWSLYA